MVGAGPQGGRARQCRVWRVQSRTTDVAKRFFDLIYYRVNFDKPKSPRLGANNSLKRSLRFVKKFRRRATREERGPLYVYG